MPNRDPRLSPQSGDQVNLEGVTFEVVSVFDGLVQYRATFPQFSKPLFQTVPTKHWRTQMASAEVLQETKERMTA